MKNLLQQSKLFVELNINGNGSKPWIKTKHGISLINVEKRKHSTELTGAQYSKVKVVAIGKKLTNTARRLIKKRGV